MNIKIRSATAADVEACGRIIYESFRRVSDQHRFPCDFPSVKNTTQLASTLIMNSSFFSIVAEIDGSVAGCNFLNEGHPIRSIGPLSVDPHFQRRGIGRRLMDGVMNKAQGSLGIRLIQETLNITSLSLYVSMGFDIKDSMLLIKGRPKKPFFTKGIDVKPLTLGEVEQCAKVCLEVCGFERTQEVKNAIKYSSPFVAMRKDRLIAYSLSLNSWMTNHCLGKTDEDMKALILGIGKLTPEPLSFLLPSRQAKFFQWCLQEDFQVVKPFTLMSIGQYNKPNGFYIPSISF